MRLFLTARCCLLHWPLRLLPLALHAVAVASLDIKDRVATVVIVVTVGAVTNAAPIDRAAATHANGLKIDIVISYVFIFNTLNSLRRYTSEAT